MDKLEDGGQAFPDCNRGVKGMSLRDYFAAKAMQVKLTGEEGEQQSDQSARWCYSVADAMLEARKK